MSRLIAWRDLVSGEIRAHAEDWGSTIPTPPHRRSTRPRRAPDPPPSEVIRIDVPDEDLPDIGSLEGAADELR